MWRVMAHSTSQMGTSSGENENSFIIVEEAERHGCTICDIFVAAAEAVPATVPAIFRNIPWQAPRHDPTWNPIPIW